MGAVQQARKPAKLSRLHKPEALDLRDWQTGLRRQFGREQAFELRNRGSDPVFSEFAVTNPTTQRTYRVVIRGEQPGCNFCSCPDYAVNTLGTCKHIEYTLHQLGRRFAQKLRQGCQPEFAEVYLRYGAQRTLIFSPGTNGTSKLRKLAETCFRPDGTLKPDGVAGFDRFINTAASLDPDFRVYDDALAFVTELRDGESRRRKLDEVFSNGPRAESAWKDLLKVPLFPYQREGAIFAARAGRALLADDMGLGKTIQAIAAAEILARHCAVERVLVVCPASLKYQWQSEVEKFSVRMARIIEGPTHARRKLYENDESFFKIVNYDVIHRDLKPIAAWKPDLVILDEAQRIKNWQTRAARTVKGLECPTPSS